MADSSRLGHFQFCIEVKVPVDQTSLSAHRETIETCQRLDKLLQNHALPATWAVDSRLADTVSTLIRPCGTFGILATTEEELGQHIENANHTPRDAHPAILVSRVEPTLLQLAQLAAMGTRAVGLPALSGGRPARVQTRHGLCVVRMTGNLPGRGHLLGRWDEAFQAKQLMHRALARKSTEAAVLRIDQLNTTSRALRSVEKTLSLAARLQSAGRLVCETLLDTHARMCPTSGTHGTQSILRAA